MAVALTGGDGGRAIVASLRAALTPTERELRVARRRLHGKAFVVVALVAASYWMLVFSSLPTIVRLLGVPLLALGLVAVGTGIMHDANHESFCRHRWVNRAAAYTSDLLGASSWLWRVQHNQLHHTNTNVDGFDPDISLYPFARLAPSQRWHSWYRWQYLYMWPLYGFLALKNLLVSDAVALWTRRMASQRIRKPIRPHLVARIAAGKLVHLGWAVFVPLLFHPWWVVLAGYLACSWLVGFVLSIIFQLAHCVDVTTMTGPAEPRRGDDFTMHQLRTTADIASPVPVFGRAFRWIAGGLDHQVEHHLAPRLPHTLYPVIARRFRRACAGHGISLTMHPGVWSAISSHARWLRLMSRPTPVAAD